MKLLAIANQKGGVGKTTTAVNLSTCLAAKGKRVLLIDLDPQGNATSALGLEGNAGQSLYEALIGHSNIKEKIVVTRFKGLSMIPADLDLAGAEIEVARLDDHLTRLREVLADLSREAGFDYLFLDCPPSLGILMTNALAAADQLLIPLQCEYFALEGLSKIVHLVSQMRAVNEALSIGGIIMTMYDARTNLSQQVVNEVRKHSAWERRQASVSQLSSMNQMAPERQRIELWQKNSSSARKGRSNSSTARHRSEGLVS
jgi:chromosome partitioning protein